MKCYLCDTTISKKSPACKVCDAPNPAYKEKVKREKKEKPPKKVKEQRTEADIVRQYANVIINKQRTRGMISDKHKDLQAKSAVNKDLWQDHDFYFSVVFQSMEQKYEFLDQLLSKVGVQIEDFAPTPIQIVNGLKFAAALGIQLKKEVANPFPAGNIELLDIILDDETL